MDSDDGILFFVAVCGTKMNVVVYHFSSTVRNLFRFDSRNDMTRTSLLLTLSCHTMLLFSYSGACFFFYTSVVPNTGRNRSECMFVYVSAKNDLYHYCPHVDHPLSATCRCHCGYTCSHVYLWVAMWVDHHGSSLFSRDPRILTVNDKYTGKRKQCFRTV